MRDVEREKAFVWSVIRKAAAEGMSPDQLYVAASDLLTFILLSAGAQEVSGKLAAALAAARIEGRVERLVGAFILDPRDAGEPNAN